MAAIEKDTVLKRLNEVGILPLFYHSDSFLVKDIVEACYDAGIRNFEFVDRGDNTLPVLKQLLTYSRTHMPEMAVGVGTIYHPEKAKIFIEEGADFIVTPALIPEVGKVCLENNIPWLPGVGTFTEIYQARQLGAEVLKLYPSGAIGSQFIKTVRNPMPDVKLLASGGPKGTRESLAEWFDAGAYAVSISSYFFPEDVIARKDIDWIRERVKESIGFLEEFRGNR
ncbi:KDPG and KHG aldolase [Pseudopedobacter saltans DSM 12145]|uniref:KDPG and KHG aldolase n=1 Tax=Pseudopedobacter saltans (strain ATCC 51119 / DSM 12145 / JCM 21818 / CCUG 39354 / LMG 10337 / NBRC 100064 / NCIMB 13643) TaxID=762903 RepID=F0S6M6_PSESL|nr:hypothetical protein [Pseudopedobacter saltans]ADY51102.1 KDPG and KHG aldolase [Pseudopedobacter saltans DSM 12145]